MTRRSARLVSTVLVLIATLPPQAAGEAAGTIVLCVFCGAHGGADFVLNVLLFLPLGVAVARPGGGKRAAAFALGCGAALSGCVEIVQVAVPGRQTALADLVANAAGAGLGGLVAVTSSAWLRPRPAIASRLGLAWGAGIAAIAVTTGLLIVPSLPATSFWGQHAPELGHFERFPGSIVEARAGGQPLPVGRLEPGVRRHLAESLVEGPRLEVTARFGEPTAGLAPILSVFDGRQREIFVLGQDSGDLIFRLRRRADRMRFHRPEHRADGLLAGIVPGDTVTVAVRPGREGPALCLEAGDARRCGLGFRVGRGWALLLDLDLPARAARTLDGAWIALLFLPLGYWARPRAGWRSGLVTAAAGLLAAPAVGPLLPAGAPEAAGVAMGLTAGVLLQGIVPARGRDEGE